MMVQTRLAQRMLEDLQLAGLGPRTQESYLRSVRQLARHFHLAPDKISEDQLRQYFLFIKNEKQFAVGSLKVAYFGIRFFYTHTVKRDWPTLHKLRVPTERKLPAVMSLEEVRQLIDAVQTPHNRAFFQTVYSLGLRLQEGPHLQLGDGGCSGMCSAARGRRIAMSRCRTRPCRFCGTTGGHIAIPR